VRNDNALGGLNHRQYTLPSGGKSKQTMNQSTNTPSFALIENQKTPPFSHQCFSQAEKIMACYHQQDIPACFQDIQQWHQKGYYLVGWFSYELAYYLEQKLRAFAPPKTTTPLIYFVAFKRQQVLTSKECEQWINATAQDQHAYLYEQQSSQTQAQYEQNIQKILEHIKQGNTYQTNYTTKQHFRLHGCPLKLYQQLREQQRVAYSTYLHFPQHTILSLSPELFFEKKGNALHCKPMKGTSPRAKDPQQDQAYYRFLENDPKNRAENVMIVDLLRNDMGKIATPGSVQVEKLFAIERYETVHQMTSSIKAHIKENTTLETIIRHLFPCGSITGAPKIKTMQIIRALEKEPRNIYTGAIGTLYPNNDMRFNVAIRSLSIDQKNHVELGVGSGIVYDSKPHDEFNEVQLKAKFLRHVSTPFALIECLLLKDSHYPLLEDHLTRLAHSATQLGFNYQDKAIRDKLNTIKKQSDHHLAYKIKLQLHSNGKCHIMSEAIKKPSPTLYVALMPSPADHHHPLIQHKTTHPAVRSRYTKALQQARTIHTDLYDIVFYNPQSGQLTEACHHSVFIEHNHIRYTPPISQGLLPGIMRAHLLKTEPQRHQEKDLHYQIAHKADRIFLSNAVRGLVEVELIRLHYKHEAVYDLSD
jgi:para-aminobenzoate synthetase/4-amino-4-deoxychorismate lyase